MSVNDQSHPDDDDRLFMLHPSSDMPLHTGANISFISKIGCQQRIQGNKTLRVSFGFEALNLVYLII